MPYICPICQQDLSLLQTKNWVCCNNHQFDKAKEGYVNLLPVQKKKSKDPGDNKEMMLARREFLNKGYYQALSDKVNSLALKHQPQAAMVLDIGCGEGYYSHRLVDALQAHNQRNMIHNASEYSTRACQLYGLDISKTAIKYAAKRYPDMNFCVASVFEMPFADNFFDLAIRIYAPSKVEELQRVIKPDGILITVSPGPKHHFAIKQKIYAEPRLHSQESLILEGFDYIEHHQLEYMLELKNEADINHLLNMTPYAWKLSDLQKQQMAQAGFSCELDFKIEIHRRQKTE
ncbi:23S rRNA (guanine(745)-N(1))-methyltransferase [Shewanella aestuarii]|uniref:23S rRNA (Guanine(745)-N(1))-methyltransferase n=1 Tax=Shewanella aestuarii TaxID=1028752 RepID=A0A6G9QJM4_9GAMM|nr:23S rRNA (guanine(745)-N(1))-methyltransferase [Shewanella aestuarii]QIR14343.1 23S rRNA (guanine(745)-N(1))-methyltransferase [Shewanella aestuarii]